MDDGSFGECIEQQASIVENEIHDGDQTHAQPTISKGPLPNDEAYLYPSRWWFASSAFPMIAATLGPVASAFSICALVRPWRQHLGAGVDLKNAVPYRDPVWLTIVNAIQLVLAVVSNIFLLLNMTRRVRFTVAQPITIIGWYISAVCLIALCATASGPLQHGLEHPKNEYIWSQAFFYGIWAAILYLVDASLMVVTFWGALAGHYDKDFVLTPSQRTLMLQTIMFLMYLLLGALVFSTVEDDWDYLDAVYWADVTLFTVGFGDYAASSTLGKALLFPYALIGVISLGLVISSIRSMILERGRRRLDARMEEKRRRRVVGVITKRGKDDVLKPVNGGAGDTLRPQQTKVASAEFERRKAEFELMRKIQDEASSRRRWMAMAISTGTWLVLWLVGALIFLECEKPYQKSWTYFDAFYLCFVTLTTIGYGDKTPISNAGKSFFVFWSLLALPTMTVLISNAGDTVVKFVRDATLRLGTITILPGEEAYTGSFRHILHRLSFGQISRGTNGSSQTSLPPEIIVGDGNHNGHSSSMDTDRADRQSRVTHAEAMRPSKGRRSLSRVRRYLEDLPTGADFHLLLVSEIQVVSQHVRDPTPHQYTFEQWAWYLKLIGEDESNPDAHRRALANEAKREQNKDEQDQAKWSWVGHRSPLMGGQEESEWVLDRLTDKLKESLSVGTRNKNRARRVLATWQGQGGQGARGRTPRNETEEKNAG